MARVLYSGSSDTGFQRQVNEDFLLVREIDDVTLAIVADGAGSTGTTYQPAAMAAIEIYRTVERLCRDKKELFLAETETFLTEALHAANRVLCAFQTANEELYNGYSTSLVCCVIHQGVMTFAHTGNTRLHLIRRNKKTGKYQVTQITKDQTEGQKLLDSGKISFDEYHIRPERLILTGGIGISAEANIQTFRTGLRENDFLLATTDGIHYALRPDVFLDVLGMGKTCDECVSAIIAAAKEMEYADNMTALLIWNTGEQEDAQ